MSKPQIIDHDWSAFSLGQRIQHLETEGYLVLPDLLDTDLLEQLRIATAQLETIPVDYSVHQRGCPNIQFNGGAITELIAHPPTLAFLGALFGDDIIFMTYSYACSEPGHPGISLHADGQPYGSKIFGFEGSAPITVRVLYYLDDLTPKVSPFRVVPRSHISLHADSNPYKRYRSHPEEVMVPVKAGGAVLIHHRVFHGNFPNIGERSRQMLAISYRPAWAGPIEPVAAWDTAELEKLPATVQALCVDRNTRHWDFDGNNKPANMADIAPGINPSRWDHFE